MFIKKITKTNKFISTRQRRAVALFIITGLLLSAVFSIFSNPIPIETPEILLLTSIFSIINFKAKTKITTLQKLTVLYLASICLNQTALKYFSFKLADFEITIPAVLLTLFLFAIAFILRKTKHNVTPLEPDNKLPTCALTLAFAIIICHSVLLYPMLKTFYGYGYEYSFKSIVNILLFLSICCFLWPELEKTKIRQCLGFLFIIYFLTFAITKRIL